MEIKRKLLATFVPNDKLDWYLDFLEIKYSISKERVFIYKNLDDDTCIITFTFPCEKYVNLNNFIYNTVIIHKKGNAIYTINALNKLIETESGLSEGNVIYQSHKIDWNKYQDKLILIFNDNLIFNTIKRIFP